ncbi:MAG TPA: D-erythronate dehydrogenase [Stellaceae bacterium]|nr:D-erythronate dehydrogenase [Stellaceae bacterium]
MHVLIFGAAGMVGRKLTEHLAHSGRLGGREVTALTLLDAVPAEKPAGFSGKLATASLDIAEPGAAARALAARPDVVFHLAAIVSGEAEADFDKGYRINLDGTRHILEAIRQEGIKSPYRARLVFASSIAVFGAPFPERIGDEFFNTPLTSYGTQKAMSELLLGDYSRRGFLDGIAIRLPTICIRPGKPNKAASGFFSNILREPLAGQEAVLPVPDTVRHWHASPRAAVGFLTHAATMDLAAMGARRALTMPGLSATVAEQIEALRRAAGEKAVRLIRREPDPVIAKIVEGWPRNFDARRAVQLGFRPDASFDEIVRIHIDEELGGKPPVLR